MQKNQQQLQRKENVGTYLTMAYTKQANLKHVVFDLSTEFNRASINKGLLSGLDLASHITCVLLRFVQTSSSYW